MDIPLPNMTKEYVSKDYLTIFSMRKTFFCVFSGWDNGTHAGGDRETDPEKVAHGRNGKND